MRYLFFYFMLLTCLVIPFRVGAASQKAGPRIAIDAPSFEFDDVKEGTVVEHAFRVVNNGDGVLRIKQIKTS